MTTDHSLGWIGMGRMGYPMAERLLKAGHSVAIWNRTRAKAEPLAKNRRSPERPRRPGHRVLDGLDRQGSRTGLFR
jgi:6-phosphogluconate dehydrogenase